MELNLNRCSALARWLLVAFGVSCHPPGQGGPAPEAGTGVAIRVNQLGYRPQAPKVAVACALEAQVIPSFRVLDTRNRTVFGPRAADAAGPFGPCAATYRLDFTALRRPGVYSIVAGGAISLPVRIADDVYRGAADSLLAYLRQQRSGYNPVFRDSVHQRSDGVLVDHPTRSGEFIPVSGGWADASDYLQYGATTAHATIMLLLAYRDHPEAFADRFQANGLPGANGIPDVLDEARWGLAWLLKMYPEDDLLLNQLADDRDHTFWDLPVNDSADYGWGRGGRRPVYPCTGKPQGLFETKNRSTGLASTAGKYAAAFALGAGAFQERDSVFARRLEGRARAVYALGAAHPGVCQTAPARSPYFYEEDDWADDMELGAVELYALTREATYLDAALQYAALEPVSRWMGQDTARHYQWYPWHNNGHYEIWRVGAGPGGPGGPGGPDSARRLVAEYYRRGLEAVARRARNGFRIGIPFIWCSNNLLASFATQATFYRRMTGDSTYVEYETAALDWLFGTNPWGVSMVIGLGDTFPRTPHSVVSQRLQLQLTGGLVDGPVYRSIFGNLRGIRLLEADEYAPFNTGFVVYHDDVGDYSTNEPIMDGTANLAYVLAALSAR
ncbi:MAG TPA: glycoside hydrolase family 9 protein [Gemmatimonadales bacterium]|nr:glycoside hydrolase family 9 protein [Gemmatimonadales bacterium]